MSVILTWIRRRLPLWVCFATVLALSVAFVSIGVSANAMIQEQIDGISGNYVSIAIMKDTEWSSKYYDEAALTAAMDSDSVIHCDRRCMLGAEIGGSKALISGAVNPTDYDAAFDDDSYNMAVLAITCNTIARHKDKQETYDEDDNLLWSPTMESYSVEATIDKVISLADGYQPPKVGEKITVSSKSYNEDGTVPFEKGKQYLIFGYYRDCPITYLYEREYDPKTGEPILAVTEGPDPFSQRTISLYDMWRMNLPSEEFMSKDVAYVEGLATEDWIHLQRLGQRKDGTYYYYPMPEAWLHYEEYTGDVEEFIASEAGRTWREEMIPLCELNQRSASVVLTDNLQSIYMFNNGQASLTEGREMTPEEYLNGDSVCIVSAEYALYNELKVGDKISVDYYNTTIQAETVYESGIYASEAERFQTIHHGPLTPENRIGFQKDYTIIGIYSAPAFRAGTHFFTADTIFAPKASLPHAEKYEGKGYRALLSLILRNGAETEFFEALKHCRYEGEYDWEFEDPNDIDFSGDFMTFNQQYDKAAGNIEVMRSNARRLLILAVLGFLIVLTAVRYFEARRQRAIVVTMKKLGIARRRIVRELIGAGLLLDLTATILGGLAAWLLFGEITRRANVGTLQLPLTTLLISAAATAIVLTLTTLFSASRLSRIALMEAKK